MGIEISGTLTDPNNSRVLYNNLATLSTATLTSSSDASVDFAKENIIDPATYNFWKPSTQDSFIDVDFGSNTILNYIAIRGHNCGTQGNTINIQSFNGVTYDTIDSVTPTNNDIVIFLFDDVNVQQYRVEFTGGSVPTVSNIFFGTQLVIPQRIYGGVTPIIFAKQTAIRPNVSDGGQFLGRSKISQGVQLSVSYDHIKADFARTSLQPFFDDAILNPFFFAWRPQDYPNEICYIQTTGDLTASNMGMRDLMSFGISGVGRID